MATGHCHCAGDGFTLHRISPPVLDDVVRSRLHEFLKHKGSPWIDDIDYRLQDTADVSGNVFFVLTYSARADDERSAAEKIRNDELAGHTWIGFDSEFPSVGLLGHVFTAPAFRRRGLATRLLRVAMEWFGVVGDLEGGGTPHAAFDLAEGTRRGLMLGVSNPNAHALYSSLGFSAVNGSLEGGELIMIKAVRWASNGAEVASSGAAATWQTEHISPRAFADHVRASAAAAAAAAPGQHAALRVEGLARRHWAAAAYLLNMEGGVPAGVAKMASLGVVDGVEAEGQLINAMHASGCVCTATGSAVPCNAQGVCACACGGPAQPQCLCGVRACVVRECESGALVALGCLASFAGKGCCGKGAVAAYGRSAAIGDVYALGACREKASALCESWLADGV